MLDRSNYHDVVAALGGEGLLLRDSAKVEETLRMARHGAERRVPVLINVWLDKTDFREGSLSI